MNPRVQQRCIQVAREMMPLCRTGRAFHMTFILNKRKLLTWATNNYKDAHLAHRFGAYVPLRSFNGGYIAGRHSEGECIKKFINKFGHSDFSGLSLFNVRIGFNGEPMLAKPCTNCQRIFIDPQNFKEVIWTL